MSSTKRAPVLITLLLAAFAVNLDTTLVNVALPDLSRQLDVSTARLQWVVDAYNLVFAAFLLSAGNLSDRLGRRRLLIVGLAVLGTASLVGAAATNSTELIAARAVMGLGSALAFPATLSLILDAFPKREERAAAIGLWGAIAGVAIALGPIVGGWLLSVFAWPSIFVAMAPVAYAAIACAFRFLPKNPGDASEPLDLMGLTASALAMGVLVFTIIQAPTYGWSSARTLIGFVASVALIGLFIDRERRSSAPMLDVRIFRNARFSAASAAVTISFFTLMGFIFVVTQYFQFIRGYSALGAGVRLLPFATAVAVGSVLGTSLAVRIGTKQIVTAGLLLTGGFYAWDVSTTVHLSYAVISMQMLVGGLGMGLTSAPATESIMGAITAKTAGVGSAVNDATRLVGGTLGVAVIGSVFSSVYQQRITGDLGSAYLPAGALGTMKDSVQGGFAVAQHLASAGSLLGVTVHQATTNAFMHGLHAACVVAAIIAFVGALVAALALPAHPDDPEENELDVPGEAMPGLVELDGPR
jgi:EmrB/QacA subfamily drug resistance transporter